MVRICRGGAVVATTIVAMLWLVPASFAATWTEVGDANAVPGTAQVTEGTGSLDSITGVVDPNSDADMYVIAVTDPAAFSARATGLTADSQLLNTQLFLFNAAGQGVCFNDDQDGPGSLLPVGDPHGPQAAGFYYLAISVRNTDPTSGGVTIFPPNNYGVWGPKAGMEGAVVDGWKQFYGTPGGAYSIALTGVEFAIQLEEPEPEDPVELLQALIVKVEGLSLQRGIKRSLLSKLEGALDKLNDRNPDNDGAAVGKLEAFIHEVKAQSGKKIGEDVAADLIADALVILDLIKASMAG